MTAFGYDKEPDEILRLLALLLFLSAAVMFMEYC